MKDEFPTLGEFEKRCDVFVCLFFLFFFCLVFFFLRFLISIRVSVSVCCRTAVGFLVLPLVFLTGRCRTSCFSYWAVRGLVVACVSPIGGRVEVCVFFGADVDKRFWYGQ